jgi:opacity protein-like surface antigen
MAIDWSARGGFTIENLYYKNIDYRSPVFVGGVPGANRFISPPAAFSGPAFGLAGGNDPQWNEDNWWLQMRGVIFIIARASQDLVGVFGIEVNSTRWGDADTSAALPGVGGGIAGRWNADAVAIQVKSMYIDFKVPSLPVWFKAGIQPNQLRNPVFLYADAAGISARVKIDADPVLISINPFWAVIRHGVATLAGGTVPTDWTTADDGNLFGVDINAAIGLIKPGIFFAMERQSQLYTGFPVPATGEGNKNLWWIGPYVDAKIGPVDATVDFVYNGGYDQWDTGVPVITDPANPPPLNISTPLLFSRRHEAWLLRGVVSYTTNKFKFGLGGLYGTGDNLSTPDKFEGYMVPFRSEATKFNDDFLILTGDWGMRQPFGVQTSGGLFKNWSAPGQGVWYVRGFADYQVTEWLKLKVNGGYIGDTSRGHAFETVGFRGGDEFGTDQEDDDSIGWELDAGVQINIYQNLYLDSAFGYLIAGKAVAGQFGGSRAQDPWLWLTSLTYVF